MGIIKPTKPEIPNSPTSPPETNKAVESKSTRTFGRKWQARARSRLDKVSALGKRFIRAVHALSRAGSRLLARIKRAASSLSSGKVSRAAHRLCGTSKRARGERLLKQQVDQLLIQQRSDLQCVRTLLKRLSFDADPYIEQMQELVNTLEDVSKQPSQFYSREIPVWTAQTGTLEKVSRRYEYPANSQDLERDVGRQFVGSFLYSRGAIEDHYKFPRLLDSALRAQGFSLLKRQSLAEHIIEGMKAGNYSTAIASLHSALEGPRQASAQACCDHLVEQLSLRLCFMLEDKEDYNGPSADEVLRSLNLQEVALTEEQWNQATELSAAQRSRMVDRYLEHGTSWAQLLSEAIGV